MSDLQVENESKLQSAPDGQMDESINQGCLIIRLTVKYFEERLGFFVEAVNDVFVDYAGSSWMETSSKLKSVD